jgi:hypothetical protein
MTVHIFNESGGAISVVISRRDLQSGSWQAGIAFIGKIPGVSAAVEHHYGPWYDIEPQVLPAGQGK